MTNNRIVGFFSRAQKSLAFRFTLILGITLLVVTAISAYVSSVQEYHSLHSGLETQAERLAQALGRSVANALFTFNTETINVTVKGFSDDPAIRMLQIKDPSGKVMASAGDAKGNEKLVSVNREVKVGNDVVGSVTLGMSTDSIDESMKKAWEMLLIREGVVLLLLFCLLTFLVRRQVTRPLADLAEMLEKSQQSGDLTLRVQIKREDEIGRLSAQFNSFMETLQGLLVRLSGTAYSVTSASETLTSVSHQMTSNSQETAAQANVVSAASEQVSKNVQTVAAGAEEMGASIKEIAKNSNEAAKVAKEAVEAAEKTNKTIAKLGDSSAEIGNVIKVITSIAEQTNLLALNATIEAARAGEAGKGFAVVANEVKELAKQTGDATEDISAKIQAIQQDTQGAVSAIQQISGVINQINDIATTIATAVEEQSVTTNEMSRNVSEAAKGSNEIVENITGVAQAAQSTASGATETQAAAQDLARLAAELQEAVSQFQYNDEGSGEAQVARARKSPNAKHESAPRMQPPQPKPTYRPKDTTLHAL